MDDEPLPPFWYPFYDTWEEIKQKIADCESSKLELGMRHEVTCIGAPDPPPPPP